MMIILSCSVQCMERNIIWFLHRLTVYDRYHRNSERSPFLRLPAEIRNRIYELALCGRVVHISVRDCSRDSVGAMSYQKYYGGDEERPSDQYLKLTHVLCLLPFDAEDKAYELSEQHDYGTDMTPRTYSGRHGRCYSTLADLKKISLRSQVHSWLIDPGKQCSTCSGFQHSWFNLALLRVCRQINKETALLPYSMNTFAFHEAWTLDVFLSKSLLPCQRRAIRSIQADSWARFTSPNSLINLREHRKSVQDFLMRNNRPPTDIHAVHTYQYIPMERTSVILVVDESGGSKGRSEVVEKIEHYPRTKSVAEEIEEYFIVKYRHLPDGPLYRCLWNNDR